MRDGSTKKQHDLIIVGFKSAVTSPINIIGVVSLRDDIRFIINL
mgnify:CR=1